MGSVRPAPVLELQVGLTRHGRHAVNRAFDRILNIILTSLRSAKSIIFNNKSCFELYGYDIMFDA